MADNLLERALKSRTIRSRIESIIETEEREAGEREAAAKRRSELAAEWAQLAVAEATELPRLDAEFREAEAEARAAIGAAQKRVAEIRAKRTALRHKIEARRRRLRPQLVASAPPHLAQFLEQLAAVADHYGLGPEGRHGYGDSTLRDDERLLHEAQLEGWRETDKGLKGEIRDMLRMARSRLAAHQERSAFLERIRWAVGEVESLQVRADPDLRTELESIIKEIGEPPCGCAPELSVPRGVAESKGS